MGDDVRFTVAEIVEGRLQPYPNLETNLVNPLNITMSFISVQSVIADGREPCGYWIQLHQIFLSLLKEGQN